MEARAAVTKAKHVIAEYFEDEGVQHISLEEIKPRSNASGWEVTVGFSRPWERNLQSILESPKVIRSYKVVTLNRDGNILSIKDRPLTSTSK